MIFTKLVVLELVIIGQIHVSAQFLHNRAFCEENTMLTESVDLYISMNIKYGAICENNSESQKMRISDILMQIYITDKNP